MTIAPSRKVALGERGKHDTVNLFNCVFEMFEQVFDDSVFAVVDAQPHLAWVAVHQTCLLYTSDAADE